MSAKAAEASPAPEKPKSRLKFILLGLLVAVLATGGAGGAWFYLNKGQGPGQEYAEVEAKRAPSVYMALETMVVNLADPGGERVAQVGITLDLDNDKAVEKVKAVLPAIRSTVLMLVSQRSSGELLKRDGKEKLAGDIATEVSRSLGFEDDEPPNARPRKTATSNDEADEPPVRKRRRAPPSPVNGVLFSSFIVQ